MSTQHYLSIKNKDGNFEHFLVPKEVYMYVHQLENAIKYPDRSGIKQLYPERFNENNNCR
jgi:hypothetical protein